MKVRLRLSEPLKKGKSHDLFSRILQISVQFNLLIPHIIAKQIFGGVDLYIAKCYEDDLTS